MKLTYIQTWVKYLASHQSDFGNIAAFFDAPDGRMCAVAVTEDTADYVFCEGVDFVFLFGNGHSVVYYDVWFCEDAEQLMFIGPYDTKGNVHRYSRTTGRACTPSKLRAAILKQQRALDLKQVGRVVDYAPVDNGRNPCLPIHRVFTNLVKADADRDNEPLVTVSLTDAYLIQSQMTSDAQFFACDIDHASARTDTICYLIDILSVVRVFLKQGQLYASVINQSEATATPLHTNRLLAKDPCKDIFLKHVETM